MTMQQARIKQWVRAQVIAGRPLPEITTRLKDIVPERTVYFWADKVRQSLADRPDVKPQSTILGLHGPRGSCKSLCGTWFAWQAYQAGRPIMYLPRGLLNFPKLPGGRCDFLALRDLALMPEAMRGALVFWDEPQVTMSRFRAASSVNFLLRRVLQQTRKVGVDMIWASNSPNELDSALAAQTDITGRCKGYLPPLYPNGDAALISFRDEHHRFGKGAPKMIGGRQIDDRITVGYKLEPVSPIFKLFDTEAITDPFDVLGLKPEELKQANEEREAGVSMATLVPWVRAVLVPELVLRQGATSAQPSALVAWIADTFAGYWDHIGCCGSLETAETVSVDTLDGPVVCNEGTRVPLQVTAAILGRAFTAAGLLPRHRRDASVYALPPAEHLEQWQRGMWHPSDAG